VSVLSPAFIEATVPAGTDTTEATVRAANGSYSGPSGLPLAAVTADSMDNENFFHVSFSPYNVVDDNLGSFWSSAETPQPHWVQVQFTHRIQVSKVVVQTRRFNGMVIASATVSTSADGGPLQVKGTVSGNSSADIPFTFAAPVFARHGTRDGERRDLRRLPAHRSRHRGDPVLRSQRPPDWKPMTIGCSAA